MPLAPEQKWLDTILMANKDKPFVKRILDKDARGMLPNTDGGHSSHSMAYSDDQGKYFVYPTVIKQPDGTMVRLSDEEAYHNARKNGNAIPFDSEQEADWFSKNYKQSRWW